MLIISTAQGLWAKLTHDNRRTQDLSQSFSMHHTLRLDQIALWPPFRAPDGSLPTLVADVPALQRGLVWSSGQVELFWDSLMRGFPVGSMIVCRKMADKLQGGRNTSAGIDRDKVTHHLLDGQQRAQAIRLGHQKPFAGESDPRAQILWLDLDPTKMGGTRFFLFRVTTKAHPWGYARDDEARPVNLAVMRESLRMCGLGNDADGFPIRPTPWECWPIDAKVPVPFGWLLAEAVIGDEGFWERLHARCKALLAMHPNWKWTEDACGFLDKAEPAALDRVLEGLKRVRLAEMVCLELPPDALSSASGREEDGEGAQVTNVEHLFQRLNGGGSPLNPDDLAYSMIKAYWPGLDKDIAVLASTRRLPEARLVTLAARLPLGDFNRESPKISTPVQVSQLRKLGTKRGDGDQSDKGKRAKFGRFFSCGEERGLESLLEQIGRWCGTANTSGRAVEPGSDLPLLIQTSIATDSRDIYALLLWMADRALSLPGAGSDEALQKPIQGLITALHWFGVEKTHAADAVMNELMRYPALTPDAFRGILRCPGMEVNGWWRCRIPPSPDELSAALPEAVGPSDQWGWKAVLERNEGQIGDGDSARDSIINNREMLIYAQRAFIARRFRDYDPADRETWKQHDRPWDFDHILASRFIPHARFPHKEAVKQWASGSIANLRAWPREDNRSDKDETPGAKIDSAKGLADSFLTEGERIGLEQGVSALSPMNQGTGELEAFVRATRARLLRIYAAWWEHAGLNIDYLTQMRISTEVSA